MNYDRSLPSVNTVKPHRLSHTVHFSPFNVFSVEEKKSHIASDIIYVHKAEGCIHSFIRFFLKGCYSLHFILFYIINSLILYNVTQKLNSMIDWNGSPYYFPPYSWSCITISHDLGTDEFYCTMIVLLNRRWTFHTFLPSSIFKQTVLLTKPQNKCFQGINV